MCPILTKFLHWWASIQRYSRFIPQPHNLAILSNCVCACTCVCMHLHRQTERHRHTHQGCDCSSAKNSGKAHEQLHSLFTAVHFWCILVGSGTADSLIGSQSFHQHGNSYMRIPCLELIEIFSFYLIYVVLCGVLNEDKSIQIIREMAKYRYSQNLTDI